MSQQSAMQKPKQQRQLAFSWYANFRAAIRTPALGPQLQAAADGARLGPWTELLTAAVVDACRSTGWACAARGSGLRPLPIPRDEYLGIDVLAFRREGSWGSPEAAFELENARNDDLVAYALWKACTVRAKLSCLFCYRPTEPAVGNLVSSLQANILKPLEPENEVLVVVGTRASATTFPDGYFRPFRWVTRAHVLRTLTVTETVARRGIERA